MIPNDSLMIRKTAGVQRCVIDFALNCPIYQVLGDCVRLRSLQTYTRWRGIADILASVSCTGWRVPPQPLRLPSVSPSPPQSWLRPARLLLLQSMLCQLCVAPACNPVQCRVPTIAKHTVPAEQGALRSKPAARSILCVPYIHHPMHPPPPSTSPPRNAERIARRDSGVPHS